MLSVTGDGEGSTLLLGPVEGSLLGLTVGSAVLVGWEEILGRVDGTLESKDSFVGDEDGTSDAETSTGDALGFSDISTTSMTVGPPLGIPDGAAVSITGDEDGSILLLGPSEGDVLGLSVGAAVLVGADETLGSADGELDCVASLVGGADGDTDNDTPDGTTLGLADNTSISPTVGPPLGIPDGAAVSITGDEDGCILLLGPSEGDVLGPSVGATVMVG